MKNEGLLLTLQVRKSRIHHVIMLEQSPVGRCLHYRSPDLKEPADIRLCVIARELPMRLNDYGKNRNISD